MASQDPEALAGLEARAAARARAGDLRGEADVRAELAHARLTGGDPVGAAAELQTAVDRRLAAGDEAEAARLLLVRGRVLGQIDARFPDARASLLRAHAVAELAGASDLRVRALQELATLAGRAGDQPEALAHLNALVDLLALDPNELASALRVRAGLHQALGDPDAALADLDRALNSARSVDNARLALQLRMDRTVLRQALAGSTADVALAEIAAEADALGDKALQTGAALHRAATALRAGDLRTGLGLAEEARARALQGDDPVSYTLAVLLIAEARERQGDRPGVLAILLTCKVTLEDRLGKEAGRPIVNILDSLADRWGEDGLAAALTTYRARVRERAAES